jgi:hypothetical protein
MVNPSLLSARQNFVTKFGELFFAHAHALRW